MSDNPSFEIESPDHFTAGAIGPPGQRVFYLQSRDAGRLVTLKVEKEHVRALAEYLTGLLARLTATPGPPARGNTDLLEPVDAVWDVGSLAVAYDRGQDRVVVEATEIQEDPDEDTGESPAMARFWITRAQAESFVERANELMKGGRPACPDCGLPMDPEGHTCPPRTCPLCSRPVEPEGHVCPRANGHIKH